MKKASIFKTIIFLFCSFVLFTAPAHATIEHINDNFESYTATDDLNANPCPGMWYTDGTNSFSITDDSNKVIDGEKSLYINRDDNETYVYTNINSFGVGTDIMAYEMEFKVLEKPTDTYALVMAAILNSPAVERKYSIFDVLTRPDDGQMPLVMRFAGGGELNIELNRTYKVTAFFYKGTSDLEIFVDGIKQGGTKTFGMFWDGNTPVTVNSLSTIHIFGGRKSKFTIDNVSSYSLSSASEDIQGFEAPVNKATSLTDPPEEEPFVLGYSLSKSSYRIIDSSYAETFDSPISGEKSLAVMKNNVETTNITKKTNVNTSTPEGKFIVEMKFKIKQFADVASTNSVIRLELNTDNSKNDSVFDFIQYDGKVQQNVGGMGFELQKDTVYTAKAVFTKGTSTYDLYINDEKIGTRDNFGSYWGTADQPPVTVDSIENINIALNAGSEVIIDDIKVYAEDKIVINNPIVEGNTQIIIGENPNSKEKYAATELKNIFTV